MPSDDLILYQFSRDRVEAGDARKFLSRFHGHHLPVGKQLGAMMDSLGLIVDGYDDDPREIYVIPEVRRFYQQLWQRWPYWLFFCNLDTENLMMMVMCCLGSLDALKVQGQEEVECSSCHNQMDGPGILDSFGRVRYHLIASFEGSEKCGAPTSE